MKVLVSACLLGENCKYNGGNNYCARVAEYVKDKEVITVCPEVMAGMGVPRTPIEIVDGVLMDRNEKMWMQHCALRLHRRWRWFVRKRSNVPFCNPEVQPAA